MANYLFKGILIGLLFGLPVGAVGAMTIQRTLNFGLKAGLVTGLGSSVADCFYAVVGAFGITFISDFLLEYQATIHLFGGILLLIMGMKLFWKPSQTTSLEDTVTGKYKLFLSSFAIGITNPATILTFLFAFSYFGITSKIHPPEGILLVCGVFLGTYLWWSLISFVTYQVKQRQTHTHLLHSNKIFGSILTLFALYILVNGLLL